ncbi:MAG: hypothetical protein ACM3TN_20205 [Alphaproteobacteria bacterium]
MAKIERFEDLIAWQKARSFTEEVYTVTRNGLFSNGNKKAKFLCEVGRIMAYAA